MKKVIDIFFLTILGCFLALPLVGNDMFKGGSLVVEGFSFQILVYLMLVGFVAFLFIEVKTQKLKFNIVDILVVVYYVYICVITLIMTPEFIGLSKIMVLTFLCVLYFIVKSWATFKDKQTLNNYFNILLCIFFITVCFQAAIAILQLFGLISSKDSSFKISGTFQLISHFSFYLGLAFPIALGVYLNDSKNNFFSKFLNGLSVLTIFLTLFILPQTLIRSSWVMAIMGSLFVLYMNFKDAIRAFLKKRHIKISLLIVLPFVLIIGSYYLYNFKQESADGRVLVWKVIGSKVMQNPVFGHGYNSVALKYSGWQADWFESGKGDDHDKILADYVRVSYNIFLEMFAETGLIGLVLFLAILFFLYRKRIDMTGVDFSTLLYAGIIAILTCGLFSFPFSPIVIQCLFFLFIALLSSQIGNGNPIIRFSINNNVKILVGLVVVIVISYSGNNIYKKYIRYLDWGFCSSMYGTYNQEDAIPSYVRCYPYLKDDIAFLTEYGNALYILKRYDEGIFILEKAKKISSDPNINVTLGNCYRDAGFFSKAENCYIRVTNTVPNRFFPYYLLAKLYRQNKDNQRALKIAQQIISKEVKVESEAIIQIKDEMHKMINEIKLEMK